MWNVIFLVSGLCFWLLLIFIYFSKKSIKSVENELFKVIIFLNGVEYLAELPLQLYVRANGVGSFLVDILSKFYLVSIFLVFTGFSLYTCYISLKKEMVNSKLSYPLLKKIHYGFGLLGSLLLVVLNLNKYVEAEKMYTYGTAVDFLKLLLGLYMVLWTILLVKNLKEIRNKKYLPMFVVLIFLVINVFLQSYDPSVLIATVVGTLTCYTMYFTIENPDIMMLNELYKNRELMEQGYEDKYNFLFEMTQEAKRPLLDLNRVTSELRQEGDPNKIKDGLAIINNLTRQLDFSINNVLNISSFDIQKLKIIDTKYNVLKVCDGLETTLRNEIKPGVRFNMELPKTVPTLYGDYMKLRQILYSLLNNASKNTENGSVNLKLNIIEKYDFCRLIFNISDTGKGMSIEKINDILSSTGELNKEEMEYLEKKEFNFKVCQKVVKIMGGNLMIKSTIGKGTDITLTLDQRVYHEKENSILNQYESAINTTKRVLIVAQNKDLANYIKKKLNNNDITYSALAYGGDAVDRIKAGKSYDYMLIEDDMKEMSGLATLQELNKLPKFNIPVIIMLNKDKDSIKEHYIEDGFTDYLLTENLEEEIKRIIDKY